MQKNILIADDHPLFQEALGLIVKSAFPDTKLHYAVNLSTTKAALASQHFTLVLLDLHMPDTSGLSELALLKKMHPDTIISIVSANDQNEVIGACLDHNADGYIIKSMPPPKIKQALQSIMKGEQFVPKSYIKIKNTQNTAQNIQKLTPAQLNVFIELGKGKLNKQIAYDLHVTEATVKAHITSIFKKLHIHNRTQAVLLAKEYPIKVSI